MRASHATRDLSAFGIEESPSRGGGTGAGRLRVTSSRRRRSSSTACSTLRACSGQGRTLLSAVSKRPRCLSPLEFEEKQYTDRATVERANLNA
ncbi:hypothetical protein [Streptomyces sp. NBC_01142]|uniref:hypothetical protein n=1 Tax=Streptomyces sp. NBC_01142 TaxID=2975865 RepID=UPI002258279E|nr:hypothetical protein [Streptomyces sp. NBC_01142]